MDKAAMRTGWTTGTCAAAAAKAAARALASGNLALATSEIPLPDGRRVTLPLCELRKVCDGAVRVAVRKDAGDDPDITHGAELLVTVTRLGPEATAHQFVAGDGVGIVTKPGLSVPVGEPAINPGPRAMIAAALAEVDAAWYRIEIAIPGGRELAAKTFNPRLGIEGGLSILGSTGIVRPYSAVALRDALACNIKVAAACGVRYPVLVPGNMGHRAANRHFTLREEAVVEVSNEWGFMLELAQEAAFAGLLLVGHPGKLGKLVAGEWDTHSSRSGPALPRVQELIRQFGGVPDASPTVEGALAALPTALRTQVAAELGRQILAATRQRLGTPLVQAVCLINNAGDLLALTGEAAPWPRKC